MHNQYTASTIKPYIIRPPMVNDAQAIKELLTQMGYQLTLSEVKNRIELFNENTMYHCCVMEISEQVIGIIAMTISDYFLHTTRFCYVDAVVIDEQYRRMGLGEKLLHTIEEIAKEQGCQYCELRSGKHREPSGTHDFYKRLGYKVLNDETTFFKKELLV